VVLRTTDSGYDPLVKITGKVQNKIGNAVHRLGGEPPNLSVVELIQAVVDPFVASRQLSSGLLDINVT